MGDHATTLLDEPYSGEGRMTPTFDELFSEHHEKVLRSAYRVTGNMQDAEDVLQSVFLRLMNNPEQATKSENPAGYLCRAAINAGIDMLRSKHRAPTELLIEETVTSDLGAADQAVRQSELKRHLREAMLSLEERTAEVFALRFLEDFSNAEIGVILGMSPNSVAVTVHRARERLQQIIGELEGE